MVKIIGKQFFNQALGQGAWTSLTSSWLDMRKEPDGYLTFLILYSFNMDLL